MYKSEVIGKGGIRARVVADSCANGVRITTMELRYHRFIHGEFLTHRLFSRNSSSSRAIPVKKMIEQVQNDPAMPIHWGKNRPGMTANEENINPSTGQLHYAFTEEISGVDIPPDEAWMLVAKNSALDAEEFSRNGYHKQIINRLLEPFQFINTVVTATEWDNFFTLRDHRDAQPEIAELARCMKQAMEESEPEELQPGDWHLPYVVAPTDVKKADYDINTLIKASAARCARVSYAKHDNTQPSLEEDLELYNMLATRPYVDKRGTEFGSDDPVHLSPLEHQATPMEYTHHPPLGYNMKGKVAVKDWEDGITHMDRCGQLWSANFRSWIQNRQLLEIKHD